MEDGAVGHPLGLEDVEGVGPRLPGVDDEGEVVGVRQGDLVGEHLPLGLRGRPVVVEVEAALAHGHHPGPAEQGLEALDAAAGVVRVHPGGRPHHAGVGGGGLAVEARLEHVAADGDHPLDPGGGGLGDHGGGGLRVLGQVAVVVGPTHGHRTYRRATS